VARVLAGIDAEDPWSWAQVAAKLPKGSYRIESALGAKQANWAALAWALAGYRYGRYKPAAKHALAKLVWPKGADRAEVESAARAIAWVRDLVNTPASDLGPAELAEEAAELARRHKANFRTIVGDALLKQNYPAIHAVGRASSRPPRARPSASSTALTAPAEAPVMPSISSRPSSRM
jgi:leucyl aminopeptidase